MKIVPVKQQIGIIQGKKVRNVSLKNKPGRLRQRSTYFWISSEIVKRAKIEAKKKIESKNEDNQAMDQCFKRIRGNGNTTDCQMGCS